MAETIEQNFFDETRTVDFSEGDIMGTQYLINYLADNPNSTFKDLINALDESAYKSRALKQGLNGFKNYSVVRQLDGKYIDIPIVEFCEHANEIEFFSKKNCNKNPSNNFILQNCGFKSGLLIHAILSKNNLRIEGFEDYIRRKGTKYPAKNTEG